MIADCGVRVRRLIVVWFREKNRKNFEKHTYSLNDLLECVSIWRWIVRSNHVTLYVYTIEENCARVNTSMEDREWFIEKVRGVRGRM